MRTLFLHVGHMKTGTTYLQSCFIENRKTLQSQGVIYPHGSRDETQIDLNVMTPVGNARHLLKTPYTLAQGLKSSGAARDESVLFSSELLFNQIWNRTDLAFIPETAQQAGFDRVRMLLFVRDPIPLAASIWQQRVKGWRSETRPLDAYLETVFDWPERALRLLEQLDQTDGIELAFHNHSAVLAGQGLIPLCENWLDLKPGSLIAPEHEYANRSMTRSEAELQRLLNVHNGASGALFAYPVTTQLTDIPRDPPVPGAQAVQACLDRQAPFLKALEARLAPTETFGIYTPKSPPVSDALTFTPAQLEVLSQAIAQALPPKPQPASVVPPRQRLLRFASRIKKRLRGG